jgi:hypothetical protein
MERSDFSGRRWNGDRIVPIQRIYEFYFELVDHQFDYRSAIWRLCLYPEHVDSRFRHIHNFYFFSFDNLHQFYFQISSPGLVSPIPVSVHPNTYSTAEYNFAIHPLHTYRYAIAGTLDPTNTPEPNTLFLAATAALGWWMFRRTTFPKSREINTTLPSIATADRAEAPNAMRNVSCRRTDLKQTKTMLINPSSRSIRLTLTFLYPAIAIGVASASTITRDYAIRIDTSSIDGTTGDLGFLLNPNSLASLTISNFSTDGVLLNFNEDGDFTGSLPGIISADGLSPYNSYSEHMTYGTYLSFSMSLTENAHPGGGGSLFSVYLSSGTDDFPLATSYALMSFDYESNQPFLVYNGNPELVTIDVTSAAPEPGTFILLGAGLCAVAAGRRSAFRAVAGAKVQTMDALLL